MQRRRRCGENGKSPIERPCLSRSGRSRGALAAGFRRSGARALGRSRPTRLSTKSPRSRSLQRSGASEILSSAASRPACSCLEPKPRRLSDRAQPDRAWPPNSVCLIGRWRVCSIGLMGADCPRPSSARSGNALLTILLSSRSTRRESWARKRTAARPAPGSTRPIPIRIPQTGFRRLRPATKSLTIALGSPADRARWKTRHISRKGKTLREGRRLVLRRKKLPEPAHRSPSIPRMRKHPEAAAGLVPT